jgi:hypothetical protein
MDLPFRFLSTSDPLPMVLCDRFDTSDVNYGSKPKVVLPSTGPVFIGGSQPMVSSLLALSPRNPERGAIANQP